jgi:hypothetical protein
MYSELVREPLPEKLLATLRDIQHGEVGATRPEGKLRRAA